MKNIKWWLIAFNLVALIGYINYATAKKETLLASGQTVLLELAPVDPRSLMQGDYMALRYAIANTGLQSDSMPKRGYCVIQLDSVGVAHAKRFQPNKTPLLAGESLINYTANSWDINIGAESYFFQEGTSEKYAEAKYGALKIDGNGNSLLMGLCGEDRKLIQ